MEAEVTVSVASVVALAAFFVGMSKGGLRGLGSLGTILVALVLPATLAIGLMLPLMIIADAVGLVLLWQHIDRRLTGPLLGGATIGVAMASVVLTSLSAGALEFVISFVVLAFTVYRLSVLTGQVAKLRFQSFLATGYAGAGAGVAAGITSTVAHLGGPPVSIHLLARQVPPLTFAGTSVGVFAVVNWLKVPGYFHAGLFDWPLLASLAPAAFLVTPGVFAGRWVTAQLGPRPFELFILGGLVIGALLLVLR